jgi:hypothetical protein
LFPLVGIYLFECNNNNWHKRYDKEGGEELLKQKILIEMYHGFLKEMNILKPSRNSQNYDLNHYKKEYYTRQFDFFDPFAGLGL